MKHNSDHLDQDQIQQTTDDLYLSGELFENFDYQDLMKEKEKQSDIYKLREIFSYLFGTQHLGNYCCYTKNFKQCSDGSDLYSIIKYKGEDLIIKVGAGEFNTDVFNTGGIQELKGFYNAPIPLFVVNQYDSYLGDEEKIDLKKYSPKEYLNKYAIIIVPKPGKAYFRGNKSTKYPIDFGEINIRNYKDALNQGRLSILHKEFPNGQFDTGQNNCIDTIQNFQDMDFDKFYNTVYKNREYIKNDDKKGNNMLKVLSCFRNMGVNRVGSGVGDKAAYQSLYDLIKSFNIQTKSF